MVIFEVEGIGRGIILKPVYLALGPFLVEHISSTVWQNMTFSLIPSL